MSLSYTPRVDTGYKDQSGGFHRAPPSTVEALEARFKDAPRAFPPVIVLCVEDLPYRLPLDALDNDAIAAWQIDLEDGARRSGPAGGGALTLAEDLPPGYHRLTLWGARAIEAVLVISPGQVYLPPALQGTGRVWGLSTQLYALRSERNWGIGDFTDLSDLAQSAAEAGAALVGVNPLHALFPDDPDHASPYSPSSRRFLNPLYLDCETMPDFAQCEPARRLMQSPDFAQGLARARAAPLVDYQAVARLKFPVLELLFRNFRDNHLVPFDARGREFHGFQKAGGAPLRDFATFHALRTHLRETGASPDWTTWPAPYRDPRSAAVRAFAQDNAARIAFHEYLQWQSAAQLKRCAERAQRAGLAIGLYIDVAVGAAHDSADIWSDQAAFARGWRIGAPPDTWNQKGQDWGLPPPDPVHMRQTAYRAFRDTLSAAMRHAGAIRLDHVLGLMRLFFVPAGAKPDAGTYVHYPYDDLMAIVALESQRHRCLVIGEDLGTAPEGFGAVLRRYGILSYKLLYFEKDERGFFPPAAWPRAALAAISTHDLPPLEGFLEGVDLERKHALSLFAHPEQEAEQRAARDRDLTALRTALRSENLDTPDRAAALHRFLARTPAMIAMAQLEDMAGLSEQMNMPGTRHEHPNWRRKLPAPAPEILKMPGAQAICAAMNAERGAASGARTEAGEETVPDTPVSLYRLQFNKSFTFNDARALVPYLKALGITHVYASPYLKARPGSPHGYDITDHNAFNPEIGTPAEFDLMCETLRRNGIGQILDFVPNHMGIGKADNSLWLDVLEWGEASPFAHFFDIHWHPRQTDLQGRVLLPMLGDHYGKILQSGALQLRFDALQGGFAVWYHEHCFPIRPAHYPLILNAAPGESGLCDETRAALSAIAQDFAALPEAPATRAQAVQAQARAYAARRALADLCERDASLRAVLDEATRAFNGTAGEAASFNALHALLEKQTYRLASWRVAGDEINFRRFFDVNELAALRMEDDAVFAHTHRLVGRLIGEGKIQGLRLDHLDGLYDPQGYLEKLQAFACARTDSDSFYIVVEKILAAHEHLREDWPVAGTTGYEFIALVNGLFVDGRAERPMTRFYRLLTRMQEPFEALAYRCKQLIIETSLASELNSLADALDVLSQSDWNTRDFTRERLRDALKDVIAHFPVYRTYVTANRIEASDRRYIAWAVAQARKTYSGADKDILDFLEAALTGDLARGQAGFDAQAVFAFAMRAQQLTSPVMAKSLEDTAFYRYNRLLSVNEVGGEPTRFSTSPSAFHHAMQERLKRWPLMLSASATHDTKRGEDMRMRLNAVTQDPQEWMDHVRRWMALNRFNRKTLDGEAAPSPNDEYMIYQTLLGAWPAALLDASGDAGPPLQAFHDRVQTVLLKSLREAKQRTSWSNPDTAYEEGCAAFVTRLLDRARPNPFLDDFLSYARRIADIAALESLSQATLKLMAPGVADIYQGTEFFDFSMVDPDNRRAVDFAARREALQALSHERPDWPALLADWRSGAVKLALLRRLLHLRKERQALFLQGAYRPLETQGAFGDHAIAFLREHEGERCAVLCGRLLRPLLGPRAPARLVWQDTAVRGLAGGAWRNALTGDTLHIDAAALALADLLDGFPVAVLTQDADQRT